MQSYLGDISKQKLLHKLRGLAIAIGLENAISILSLEEINSSLKKYLQGQSL